jgi:hypothetical protein
MSIKAMKQALEALVEGAEGTRPLGVVTLEAIIDLRQAIEQAEKQEPVAWIDALKDAFFEGFTSVETYNDTLLNSAEEAWAKYKPPVIPPAAQRQWVGLTDEDLSVCDEDGVILAHYWEAKLKQKNGYAEEKNT